MPLEHLKTSMSKLKFTYFKYCTETVHTGTLGTLISGVMKRVNSN